MQGIFIAIAIMCGPDRLCHSWYAECLMINHEPMLYKQEMAYLERETLKCMKKRAIEHEDKK